MQMFNFLDLWCHPPQRVHLLSLQSLKQLDKNLVDNLAFTNLLLTEWANIIFANFCRNFLNWKVNFHAELIHFQLHFSLSITFTYLTTYNFQHEFPLIVTCSLLRASPLSYLLFHRCGRHFNVLLFCRCGRHITIDTLHTGNRHQAFPFFGIRFVLHFCDSKSERSKRKIHLYFLRLVRLYSVPSVRTGTCFQVPKTITADTHTGPASLQSNLPSYYLHVLVILTVAKSHVLWELCFQAKSTDTILLLRGVIF